MQDNPQIDPEHIRSLLADEDIPLDIAPEVAARLGGRIAAAPTHPEEALSGETLSAIDPEQYVDPTAEAEEARNKMFDTSVDTLSGMAGWSLEIERMRVDVTEMEKALYMKALLTDEQIVLPISLECGVTVHLRPLQNYEMDVVFQALEADKLAERVQGPAQYATAVQYYAAAFQVVAYCDKPREYVKFEQPWPLMKDSVAKLQEVTEQDVKQWYWPKWQAVVTALRIFEAKLALCNTNADNKNFWNPAEQG